MSVTKLISFFTAWNKKFVGSPRYNAKNESDNQCHGQMEFCFHSVNLLIDLLSRVNNTLL